MFGLIAAETAIFTIFIVAYLFYLGKSLAGPTPKDVLDPPVFFNNRFHCPATNGLHLSPARQRTWFLQRHQRNGIS